MKIRNSLINIFKVATLSYILVGQIAFASGSSDCHFHGNAEAPEQVVLECANKRVGKLIQSGKLDASWKGIKSDSIMKFDGKKTKEWKVIFKNSTQKDSAKQTLFMYFSLARNSLGQNFNGK